MTRNGELIKVTDKAGFLLIIRNRPVVIYTGRYFSKPAKNTISVPGYQYVGETPLCASDVFEALDVDLELLSQIFVRNHTIYYCTPKDERLPQPAASSYATLGICGVDDYDGWRALAELMDKTVQFFLGHDKPEPEPEKYATYFPNGTWEPEV